ncbi:carbohydrate-binding protein [Streptacidiphilus jiangxiensis]|uniref:Carbohydrate binding module (Family 6) n=1 Tax=Streptacidiphilus jiangxiensis TaxID=235985 RepID=A0A1H7RI43_STRJI|nr:carbohydrate-binding protein [Streptacidiphilus jiangxiensis]SEL59853.1 Carbohydrate binding module (family 6) [Streptacidiphilus jiangxiensis]
MRAARGSVLLGVVLALLAAGAVGYALLRGGAPASGSSDGSSSTGPGAVGTPPPGWSTVWRDDFGGPAGAPPDPASWVVDTGTGYPGGAPQWGTGEVERYTTDPANLRQDGQGHLLITPQRDAAGRWTSARIETRRTDFRPAPGSVLRFEARLQLPQVSGPAALGYWPSFWALGAGERTNPNAWPGIGEFDVVENVNGDNTVRGTMHCGVGQGGPCNEKVGLGGTTPCAAGACRSGFHTYALEWDRSGPVEELRWYLDGVDYWTVKASDVSPEAWRAATTAGDFLLLNVAVGGQFPDALAPKGVTTPTADTRPGVPMVVDYVSVLQRSGRASTVAGPAPSLPTLSGNGATAELPRYDFGSELTAATGVTLGYRATTTAKLELRVDSPSSPTIGALDLPAGSGTVTATLHLPTKGVHDLYLTLVGSSGATVTVASLQFTR